MKKLLTSFLSLLILGISGFTYGEKVETEIVKFSNGFKVGNVDTNVYTNMPSGGSSTNIINTNRLVAITTSDNIGFENSTAPVAGQSSSVWMGQYALASAAGVGNTMIGWAAGYQGGGNTSVGIGYQTLYQSSGNDNVGIGNGALARVTGNQNTAVGAGAGNSGTGTNALRSTFIGADVAQNIGGTENVGVGYEALKQSTGDGNTAINSAMKSSPSTNSVAIGGGAGSLSPGVENVSIGYVSGNLSTGSYNSSVGPGSRWKSVGSYNNAFGLHALADCYGSYNVAFGSESLRYGTGNYNVAIGEFAGEHTGGTSNTYIGAYSGNSATYAAYTNTTTIGANVKPKGSGTVAIGLPDQTTYVDGNLVVSGNVTFARNTTQVTTNALIIDTLAATNFVVQAAYSELGLQYGRMWVSNTNLFSRTCTLTWYDYNDFNSSNAYWRANVSFVSVKLTNDAGVGTNIIYVDDASGFTTNALLWFGLSNSFVRASAITGNTVYLESPMPNYEAITSAVSKVVEFGGFNMSDGTISNKLFGRLESTNAFSATINGIYKYKR